MGIPKRPGKAGACKAYISRSKAVAKLNLTLKEFRRLCILKGVYPVEPRNKKKLTNGDSRLKTYYLLSDIQYLSHEPIIWKFWEFKIFMKRLSKASGRRDFDLLEDIRENKPLYRLDHIVRERYPTFVGALRDLDDGLSMTCLISRFSKSSNVPLELITISRRVSVDFMRYVIESRSLRKVFVSIKGYYYQAEVMGELITWVVPHDFVLPQTSDVDIRVMRTFTEFYVHLLGFVNFKLFTTLGINYPLSKSDTKDMTEEEDFMICLNKPLLKPQNDDVIMDTFDEEDDEVKGSSGLTLKETIKLQKLFDGLVVFLNREVPREPLLFVLRSFGAKVSWDKNVSPGATFLEDDERITHHVVDRNLSTKYLNRVYIQPQWVFDSVNAKRLMDVQEYFPGTTLPPHLSPFVEHKEGDHVTPDVVRLGQNAPAITPGEVKQTETGKKVKPKRDLTDRVVAGKVKKVKGTALEGREEKKLAEMMIPRKKKKLYDLIVASKERKRKAAANLTKKRAAIDSQ